MSRGQRIFLVFGLLALVILCASILAVGSLSTAAWWMAHNRAQFQVDIRQMPEKVNREEKFRLLITVRNTGDVAIVIDRVRLPEELLAVAHLESVSPEDLGHDHKTDILFAQSVLPGAVETITLVFQAKLVGEYTSLIEVHADGVIESAKTKFSITDKVDLEKPTTVSGPVPSPTKIMNLGVIPYPAVVRILAMIEDDGESIIGWSGSGSIISPDGLILTNAHVVLSDKYFDINELQIGLTLQDDSPPEILYTAEVLQADAELDIAVIRINKDLRGEPIDPVSLDLPFVSIGDSDQLSLGDTLTILGYPGIGGDTITLTRGDVSGFSADTGGENRAFIKTTATIAGGNSGGLAANATGELIGVPTQLGYGGEDEFVDCRVLADTNRDGRVDERDSCVPTGGFINALRPINLAIPLIEAAQKGEVMIVTRQLPQNQIPEGGEIIYQDDFSDAGSGWDVGGDTTVRRSYTDGEYHIRIVPDNYYGWGNPGKEFRDVIISVDVHAVQSTQKGDFGLLCRYQNENNFYALEISEDGYYAIWKVVDGEFTELINWSYSSDIPQAEQVTITAACVGDSLSLVVNDVIIAKVTDNEHTLGDIGLIAGTWQTGDQIIAFDNFVVREP